MSKVDGVYDCVAKTPLGDQTSGLAVVSHGDTFQGISAAQLGSMDVSDGKVDGNRLTWKMKMPLPIQMTLICEATVEGDTITGTIDAGAFGICVMKGARRK